MSAQKNIYINFSEIDELQTKIMKYVDFWVHTNKTTVPLRSIIKNMEENGIKKETVKKAIFVLVKKGYIRRSLMVSNTTNFVQLRNV